MQHLLAQEMSLPEILLAYDKQFKQIKRRFSDEHNGRCAMGLILSYYGWEGHSDASKSMKIALNSFKEVGISRGISYPEIINAQQ